MAIGLVVRRLNIPRQTAAFANKGLVLLSNTQQKWVKLKHWRGSQGKIALESAPVLEFDVETKHAQTEAQQCP